MKTNQFDDLEYNTDEMRETLRAFVRSYGADSPDDSKRLVNILDVEFDGKRNLLKMVSAVMTLAVMSASLDDASFSRSAPYFPHNSVSVKDYPFFLFCIAEVSSLTMFERVFWNNTESYEKYSDRLTRIHDALTADYKLGVAGCGS